MHNLIVARCIRVVCLALVAVLLLSVVQSARARDTKSYAPLRRLPRAKPAAISRLAPPGDVVVKFKEGMTVHSDKDRLGNASAARVVNAFTRRGLPAPLPSITGDPSTIAAKRVAAEDRVKTILPDLSLYFRHSVSDPLLAAELIDELNTLDEVEIAYFAPRPEVASGKSTASSGYLEWLQASTTPDFTGDQLHLNAAPDGVSARAAWTLPGGTGLGVQIIDIEYGWQLTHEDLPGGATAVVIGSNQLNDTDHGTAVMGEMASGRNGFGMTGIAYEADIGCASVATMSTANAITQAANASDPGDVLLIELHAPGPRYNFEYREDQNGYIAMEYFPAEFDAILNAWAQGVIVCEAAGNGSEDFDDPIYDTVFNIAYRNSHAIVCGAGNPPDAIANDRSKLGFSNWGQRVELQGYGILVRSTGYGDLYSTGGQNYWYTAGFSGTSSASPIVTGAVISVSGVFQQMLGFIPDADTIRSLLVSTGSPQQSPYLSLHIGPRPNLQAAMAGLFDPIDSLWYEHVTVIEGQTAAVPIRMKNSHAVGDLYLPFKLNGPAPITIDSITRGPRTTNFEYIQMLSNSQSSGKAAASLRADNGGGTFPIPGGDGIIAYLWVHAGDSTNADVDILDTATVGVGQVQLRLVSAFDDGTADYFSPGSITTEAFCQCNSHGDVSNDGIFSITDVVGLVNIAFRNGAAAITDPGCLHATRADYTCNGVIDVQDVVRAIDLIFRAGAPICDPCAQ